MSDIKTEHDFVDPVIQKMAEFAQSHFASEGSGHDWWHVYRVWQMARQIATEIGGDLLIVEVAALLHDVSDWKLGDKNPDTGLDTIRSLLKSDIPAKTIDEILEIITSLSYKGAGVKTPMTTLEGQIVQDADRLDAMGALGIARAFAYGGHAGRLIHHPEIKPEMHSSFDAYKKNNGPSINHFYEKLLLLKERMNTPYAKQIAEKRHLFMTQYLEQFFKEWNGTS